MRIGNLTSITALAALLSLGVQAQVNGVPRASATVPGAATQNAIKITDAPYNASSTRADNAAALQSAINAAVASGRPLQIPAAASCYKYTAPLTISGNLTIVGDALGENWTAQTGNINVPQGTPPLLGSVLCPSSNGADGIDIYGTALVVNLTNVGIQFQYGATAYTNTGHGINYTPPAVSGGYAQGLSGSTWDNVKVWGHDGNHYAFNLINPIYDTFSKPFTYGGGGWNIYGAGAGDYGNLVFIHPFTQVIVGGSAWGYKLTGAGGLNSNLNLMTFIRPQSIVQNNGTAYTPPVPTVPTSAQYVWYQDANVKAVTLVAPDFESTTNSPVQLTANNGNSYGDQIMGLGGDVVVSLAGAPIKQAQFGTGQKVTGGFFNGATSGTVNFDQAFPNGVYAVVCTGWGHTCQLNSAPTVSGFTYTQSGAGASYYMAYGY